MSGHKLEGRTFDRFQVIVDAVRQQQAAFALGRQTSMRLDDGREAVLPMLFTNGVQQEITGVNPVWQVVSARALLASQTYWLPSGPVLVGEHLSGQTRVAGVTDGQGRSGPTRRVRLETDYLRSDGSLALRTSTESLDLDPEAL